MGSPLLNLGLKENYQNKKVIQTRRINSTLMFVVAFVVINFLLDFMEFLFATIGGAHPRWFYWGLKITSQNEVRLSSLAFILGPLLCLSIGFISFSFFKLRAKVRSFNNILFVWIGVIGISMFLTQLFYLNFNHDEEFGVIFKRLALGDNFLTFSNIVVITGATLLGIFVSGSVLQLTNSKKNLMGGAKRRRFIIDTILVPWILGSLVCYFYYLPKTTLYQLVLMFLMLYVIIVAVAFGTSSIHRKAKFSRYPSSEKILIYPIVFSALIYLFFHVAFFKGIKF